MGVRSGTSQRWGGAVHLCGRWARTEFGPSLARVRKETRRNASTESGLCLRIVFEKIGVFLKKKTSLKGGERSETERERKRRSGGVRRVDARYYLIILISNR